MQIHVQRGKFDKSESCIPPLTYEWYICQDYQPWLWVFGIHLNTVIKRGISSDAILLHILTTSLFDRFYDSYPFKDDTNTAFWGN